MELSSSNNANVWTVIKMNLPGFGFSCKAPEKRKTQKRRRFLTLWRRKRSGERNCSAHKAWSYEAIDSALSNVSIFFRIFVTITSKLKNKINKFYVTNTKVLVGPLALPMLTKPLINYARQKSWIVWQQN